MHLNTKDREHLMLHFAGEVARKRKERGVKLNYPESIAYITYELMERARDGASVSELMQQGREILTVDDVMPGVADMISDIQIETTFVDGTKLVTVHDPIV